MFIEINEEVVVKVDAINFISDRYNVFMIDINPDQPHTKTMYHLITSCHKDFNDIKSKIKNAMNEGYPFVSLCEFEFKEYISMTSMSRKFRSTRH